QAVAPRTHLSRRQFSIFTIRPARNVLSRKARRARGKNLRSSWENLAKLSRMTRARALRFWWRRRIRRRESAFAQNWRRNSREYGGAFTNRALVRTQTSRCKQLSAPTHGYCRN